MINYAEKNEAEDRVGVTENSGNVNSIVPGFELFINHTKLAN